MRPFKLTMALPNSTKTATLYLYPTKSRPIAQKAADAVAAFAQRRGVSAYAVDYDLTPLKAA